MCSSSNKKKFCCVATDGATGISNNGIKNFVLSDGQHTILIKSMDREENTETAIYIASGISNLIINYEQNNTDKEIAGKNSVRSD